MTTQVPIPSFFFGMMGTPFQNDGVTTLFRMVETALARGHHVTVWTCGHATGLSQRSLVRPPDYFSRTGESDEFGEEEAAPLMNTAEMIEALFRVYGKDDRLEWFVCRYCMEERGTTQQIEQVRVRIPFTFQHYLSAADVSIVMGVKS